MGTTYEQYVDVRRRLKSKEYLCPGCHSQDLVEEEFEEYDYDIGSSTYEKMRCINCNSYHDEDDLKEHLKKWGNFEFWTNITKQFKSEYQPKVINEFYFDRYREYYKNSSWTVNYDRGNPVHTMSGRIFFPEKVKKNIICNNCDVDCYGYLTYEMIPGIEFTRCLSCLTYFVDFEIFKLTYTFIKSQPRHLLTENGRISM